jgi:hypothetical protein
MSRGSLKCIGTPQHLKSRFGQGYKIDIVVEEDKKGFQIANDFILSLVPEAKLVAANGCYLSYQTPKHVKLSKVGPSLSLPFPLFPLLSSLCSFLLHGACPPFSCPPFLFSFIAVLSRRRTENFKVSVLRWVPLSSFLPSSLPLFLSSSLPLFPPLTTDKIVAQMEIGKKKHGIINWGLSQASLQEVFLTITKQDEGDEKEFE